MKKPTGQLYFVIAMLLFQIAVAGIVVIGSYFEGREGREVGFCISFLGCSASALIFLIPVYTYLQQSPESDGDKSDDS